MLYRKLQIKTKSSGTFTRWFMILKNENDVMKYMKKDADDHVKALLNLNLSDNDPVDPKEKLIKVMLDCKSLKEGTVEPVEIVSDIVNKKTEAMLKLVDKGYEISINEKGGYCTYDGLGGDSDISLVEEREIESLVFPSDEDDDIFPISLLVIENDKEVPKTFIEELKCTKEIENEFESEGFFNVKYLTELRHQSSQKVIDLVSRAKIVALETVVIDMEQVKKMMQLFDSLSDEKIIIVKTQFQDKIVESFPALYKSINNKHKVKFI